MKKKTTAVKKIEVEDKEMELVKEQAAAALNYALDLEVKSDDDYKAAMEEGKRIKVVLEGVTKRKEEITKPLNDALKSTRDLFRPIEDSISSALASIKGKMTVFFVEEKRKADLEQAKLAARVEKGTMKTETAMRKMDEVKAPEKSAKSETASSTMRTVQKYRVVDKSKIPLEFLDPNMVAIKNSFKQGKPVEGVEQYEEQELAIS